MDANSEDSGLDTVIIINADDWGRSREETDAALACYVRKRVTSVSAMVFMEDSERAAELAKDNGVDAGLHLNLSQRYTGEIQSPAMAKSQDRIVRFMTTSKYAMLIYRPGLREDFRTAFQAQIDEFLRLYGNRPSHIDGHQHRHLCANILLDRIIPEGHKIRKNFSFWPGEKSALNRAYRRIVDRWLARRYSLTDYFFALSQCLDSSRLTRVVELAKVSVVELMTHPCKKDEYVFLMSDRFLEMLRGLQTRTYSQPPVVGR